MVRHRVHGPAARGPGLGADLYIRYINRTLAYAAFLREEYPPFVFGTTADDEGEYPAVRTAFEPQYEDRNRVTVGFRLILVIPQLDRAGVPRAGRRRRGLRLGLRRAVHRAGGRPGSRDFVVGVMRWNTRVSAYLLLLVDDYPPFSLD